MTLDRQKGDKDIWDHTQMILYFLNLGNSYQEANSAIERIRRKFPDMVEKYNRKQKESVFGQFRDPESPMKLSDFYAYIDEKDGKKD
jgi:hypothetical protein